MTEVEEKTEFKFSELSDGAKQRAINEHAAPDYDWWDFDWFKEEGKAKGFEIADIYFSGFSSQGDGASWIGRVDLKTYLTLQQEKTEGIEFTRLEALLGLIEDEFLDRHCSITKRGRGEHEMTMSIGDVETYYEDTDVLASGPLQGANVQQLLEMYCTENQLRELEEEILEAARDYAREIYKALEAEYDSYFEEENFAGHAEINEWKFDEDGRLL